MTGNEPILNKMRHPEYARDEGWIVNFLNEAQVAHIATREDEQPYITPSLFWYSPEKHEIYFHSNVQGHVRSNAENLCSIFFHVAANNAIISTTIHIDRPRY